MSNSFPYFPFYAADFEIDTRAYTVEAVGAYIRLLIHQWINGSVPQDELQLARIAGCTPDEFVGLWDEFLRWKFRPEEDDFSKYYINPRLEHERQKTNKVVEQKRKAGKKSAEARKKKATKKQTTGTPVQQKANGKVTSQSQSHSQKELTLSPNGESPRSGVPYEELKDLYNKICVDLKACRVLNDKRRRQLKWCWKQKPDLKWWEESFFPECQSSKFLRGEQNGPNHPNFKGHIEIITRQEWFARIIEGVE